MAERNCGGVWEKTSKKGEPYLSMSIEIDGKRVAFTAFKNKHKEPGDNKPDWSVYPKKNKNEDSDKGDSSVPF